jgi:hypothetical protein
LIHYRESKGERDVHLVSQLAERNLDERFNLPLFGGFRLDLIAAIEYGSEDGSDTYKGDVRFSARPRGERGQVKIHTAELPFP